LHMKIEAGEGMTTRAVFEVTQHHQGAPGPLPVGARFPAAAYRLCNDAVPPAMTAVESRCRSGRGSCYAPDA
jgi:hypothetical protein